jgi:multidrug efflux pump subunit AcrB
MVITIWVLSLIGETINQMTLASLIIALGLLVDNAIVVSEAILVRISDGENPVEAAVAAARELRTPLLVSSLTTAAAFLPIFLAESAVGEYTGALFKVVAITLLISWVLAITLIPLLATLFMRPKQRPKDLYSSVWYRTYRQSLGVALRRRWLTLAITLAVFVGSLGLWSRVPQIFFPDEDRAFLMAALNLPAGTSMEATQEMAARVDRYIEDELRAAGAGDEGVTSWTTFIGESPPTFRLGFTPSPSLGGYCELMIHTTSAEFARETIGRLHRFAIHEFPDIETDIRMLAAGPPSGTPVQIRISGTDTDPIFNIVDQTQAKLREIPGTVSVSQDWGARVKKLAVTINENRARRAGISNEEAAMALNAFASGMESTRYREEDDSIPVLLRSVGAGRRNLDRLRNIAVFSGQTGRSTPLSQIANIDLEWEPSAILRYDRYRTVTVGANVEEGTTALGVFQAIQPWLEEQEKTWPPGYRWEFGGEFESSVKANQSIADKMPVAGLLIVLLLVLQFNSLRKPTIILSTIVLALIGVAVGLVVLDSYFGFMTLLGVVSLAGIVINNAIVLLDRIQIELDAGSPPATAVVEAAQQRVRPILLTTATTVASLLPLYLTGGAMWEPMAIAIMFGLVFSTMLTLVVVPVLYCMMYRVPGSGAP